MVRHLLCQKLEALVLAGAFVGLAEKRVEGLVAGARQGAGVAGDCERGDLHHALVGVVQTSRLVQQFGVLELFAQPLEDVERLIQGHRHADLGQVFADVPTEEVPQ